MFHVHRPSRGRDIRCLPPSGEAIMSAVYAIPDWGQVVCRLWRSLDGGEEAYDLEMFGLGMYRLLPVGRDGERAGRLFSLIVRNTVTPCTLEEVLEDLDESLLSTV